jgi:hypothetical protein
MICDKHKAKNTGPQCVKMEMESFPDMSESPHTLMWLSAQEHFVEFHQRKSFETYTTNIVTK